MVAACRCHNESKASERVAKEPTEFGGQERFAASPEKVYALLTNLDAMAATIPDLVSAEKSDDARTLKCVVRPGFSFLRGTMRLAISLGDCRSPQQRHDENRRAGNRPVDGRRFQA